MTHEIQHNMERKLHRGALLMGAVLVGGLVEAGRTISEKRRPDITDVKSYFEDDGPSFLFFRGCGENYQAQAPLFHRKLSGFGSLHFEYQIQGKHSQALIDQNVIKACKEDGDRDRVLVCSSMGLMNAMRSLRNPAVLDAMGEGRVQAIVSRSGITSRADLQPNMQRAADFSSHTPALSLVGDIWRANRMRRVRSAAIHGPTVTTEEARMHHESSAYMPFPLVSSQHEAIHQSMPWRAGSHRIVTEANPGLRLYQITAEHDNVANWKSTNRSLEDAFEAEVETIIDARRPHGSHADDLEFIEPLEELMMKLSGRQRDILAAAKNLVAYSGGYEPLLAA